MAKQNRLTRYLSLVFDRTAARRMEEEAEASLARAGKRGSDELEKELAKGGRTAARALTKSLEQEYKLRMAKARLALAEGAIDEGAFEREGRDAAKAFDRGLASGIRQLKTGGSTTDLEIASLTRRFKTRPGGRVPEQEGLLSGFLAPVATYVTLGAALQEANAAIDAADRMAASTRKLGGAAKVTGTDLAELENTSERLQQTFGLSVPFANDLVASMNKLAVRAGDANATFPALTAWLDLAAANGLDAERAMEALNTTIIGQDEGLNKLGLANPQQLYEHWAAAAGTSAAKMTDAQKAQAILNAVTEAGSKVQGEYGKFLESNAGQAGQLAQKVETLRARSGEAIQPLRLLGLELKTSLYESLGPVVAKVAELLGYFDQLDKRGERWWQRLFGGGPADGSRGRPFTLPGTRVAPARNPDGTNPRLLIDGVTVTAPAPPEAAGAGGGGGGGTPPAPLPQPQIGVVSPGPDTSPDNLTGVGVLGVTPQDVSAFDAMLAGVMENAAGYGQEAAYEMSSAFQDAFSQMMEEGATFGSFMEALGKGMAGAVLAGIAQIASAKSAEMFARAIEAGATALLTGNPAAAASIPEWIAAGTAYAALAGLAGAARGAVTGGAGAIPPSTRDAGLGVTQGAERQGPEVHIYIDPLDPARPAVQRVVYRANQLGEERFNGAEVHVHPAQRGAA